MQQAAIHDYLVQYFKANDCAIIENRNGFLKVKLTVDLDKLLMNRPFYWHYIEKIGGQAETATLTLRTAETLEEGEFIHFGSPRLHQIFRSAKTLAPYIRLFQQVSPKSGRLGLDPWLGINYKISYQCDLKKDRILSLGLQLINGTLVGGFQDVLESLSLTPKIPDFCYTLNPLIKPVSGIRRIEAFIEDTLQKEPADWAASAVERWHSDMELLDAFYEEDGDGEKPEAYFQEKKALKAQYEPKIHVNLINCGLFYLQSKTFLK